MRDQRRPSAQLGVAIISVLLTVVLATIIVSGLFLREHVTVRSVQNQVALTQTRWVERAAIDWSKVILMADLRASKTDHLSEPWAVPVAETRLDETVTAGAKLDDDSRAATLTGQMFDAQARLNLNLLVQATAEGPPIISVEFREVFRRLLDLLSLPSSLSDTLAARILAAAPATPAATDSPVQGALQFEEPEITALPLLRPGDLRSVRGFGPEVVEVLAPFVTFLPGITKINVNTAPAEVLAAVVPGLDLGAARQLATQRDRTPFKDLADFRAKLTPAPEKLDEQFLTTGSNYFLVRGLIRFGRVQSFSETLLERQQQRVNVIWQRRL